MAALRQLGKKKWGQLDLDIVAAHFDSSGNRLGNEFTVNQTTGGDQYLSSIASLDSTQFVVVWSGEGSGDSAGLFARQFGTATGSNQAPTAIISGVTLAWWKATISP